MRFAVADVTGNVKYIRKGDYRLLSGGGGGGGSRDHAAPPLT